MPTTTGNITAIKNCTAAFKKKSALQYCGRQSCDNFSSCRGITLSPVVFASLTGFGLVVKAVASFKKYDRNAEKANFARVE